MLAILGYVAIALCVGLGIAVAIASRKPDEFRVARTLRIDAPAERIFPLISNLEAMNTWNPYALRETGGTFRYAGPASGAGAECHFDGPNSGSGRIAISRTAPPSQVVMRLVMTKPIKADNEVTFTVDPNGPGSDVTWAMAGRSSLPGKCLSLFIDCDAMCAKDFDEGLRNLKRIAETAPSTVAA